ncbi:hypothetical protein [Streptosporangium sp. NPDC002524]|uniref:hypothetical protein n=1 Tax=Streptosporangium sp. NPDC002524 TaxID=3154537 RepID=UPI0033209A73
MSKQTSFMLMLLLAFSVIVPGSAGYLSVKMEAIGQAHRELLTLESRIRAERLAARIRKVERASRDRNLQPIISSGRAPCDPSVRSRDEPGARSSDPAAVVPVPVAGGERSYEGRLRARRHVERRVPQRRHTWERHVRGPETRRPDTGVPGTPGMPGMPGTPGTPGTQQQDVREPEAQRLTAQGRPGAGATGEAAPVQRWPQLERRGRPHREGEAREEHAFAVPDPIGAGGARSAGSSGSSGITEGAGSAGGAGGAGNAPEGTGALPGEDLPPDPPQTGTRAN